MPLKPWQYQIHSLRWIQWNFVDWQNNENNADCYCFASFSFLFHLFLVNRSIFVVVNEYVWPNEKKKNQKNLDLDPLFTSVLIDKHKSKSKYDNMYFYFSFDSIRPLFPCLFLGHLSFICQSTWTSATTRQMKKKMSHRWDIRYIFSMQTDICCFRFWNINRGYKW